MSGILLDVNVLLAAAWPSHVHHQAVRGWMAETRGASLATCGLVQLGFVRLSSNPRFSPAAVAPADAWKLLQVVTGRPWHRYWGEPPDGIAHPAMQSAFARCLTHRQVTDVYLVAVARTHGGKLATLDRGLSRLFANDVLLIQ